MNIHPVRAVQYGLAFVGIGSLYIYRHPEFEKETIIEGPYRSFLNVRKDLPRSAVLSEAKFHFRTPKKTENRISRPGASER